MLKDLWFTLIYSGFFSASVSQDMVTGKDSDLKIHAVGTGDFSCLDIVVNVSCDSSLEIHKRLLMTSSFISDEDLSRPKSFKKYNK